MAPTPQPEAPTADDFVLDLQIDTSEQSVGAAARCTTNDGCAATCASSCASS